MNRRSAKKSRSEADAPQEALYVYCLGERAELSPVFDAALPDSIEGATPLELIMTDELAAVASAVPLSEYGEESLPQHLSDPVWTASRAMRHQRVVEHFAARANVVPLRFGTIYFARRRISQILAEKQAGVRAIIERVRGREEWGVNIYSDRSRLAEVITQVSPQLRELVAEADGAAPGQAYLLRKKIDARRTDETRRETKRIAKSIEAELAAACDETAALRVHKDDSMVEGELIAKLACLVARIRFAEFHAEAERLAAEHADHGFRIELTGPWPAYTFATEI